MKPILLRTAFIIALIISIQNIYAQSVLWGVTSEGGANGYGTVFNMPTGSGTLNSVYSFTGGSDGAYPYGSLMRASNGRLYGTTIYGAAGMHGGIYQFDPFTGTLTPKVGFDSFLLNSYAATLVETSLGKLYGMGGPASVNTDGAIYEYDYIKNILTLRTRFVGSDGSNPVSSLIKASDGKLYGMTMEGGISNKGVLFEYNISKNRITKKVDFAGPNGASPFGSLIQASDGKLYGMTTGGGTENVGVLFQYDIASGTYTVLHEFTQAVFCVDDDCYGYGDDPRGSLIQASNGKLYGLSMGGKVLSFFPFATSGLLFEYDIQTGAYSPKAYLPYQVTGTLTQATNGKLYGSFTSMGSYKGGIFEYAIGGTTADIKYNFNDTAGANPVYLKLLEINCTGTVPGQPKPISVSGGNALVCPGETRTYTTAQSANVYFEWTMPAGAVINSGQGTNTISVTFNHDFTGNGKISVVKINTCGKSMPRTLTVKRNDPPAIITTNGGPTEFCSGTTPLTLIANEGAGYTYQWKKGATEIAGATEQTYMPGKTSNAYKVAVINPEGCSAVSDGIAVTVYPLPAAKITPQGSTTFCEGDSVVLKANAGAGLTYQWRKGANNIAGATGQNYTATTAGTYKVIVTDAATGCSKTSPGVAVVINCRQGFAASSADNLQILPNPSPGKFMLQYNMYNEKNAWVSIYNAVGIAVYEAHLSVHEGTNQKQIDISGLPAGVYMLRLKSGNSTSVQKLVKE